MRLLRPAMVAALILAGGRLNAQQVTPLPTEIESSGPGEMVSTEKETTITFRDNVRVTGTNIRLTCDFLQVVVERVADPAATLGELDKFRSLVAVGRVRIVQGDREAACGRAEVLPGEDKIILTENPVVVLHDENVRIAGKKITMLRGERRVTVDEPVLLGPPIKDLGFDREEKKPDGGESPPAAEPKTP